MATTTTNLSLRKPATSDTVSVITDIANNMQLIDDFCAAGTPVNQAIGDAAAAGTVLQASRSDHKHGMPAFATPASVGAANANGSASTVPRSDHVHGLGSAAFGVVASLTGSNVNGVATTASRSDHLHAIGAGAVSTTMLAANAASAPSAVYGATGSPNTTSTTDVVITDMTTTFTTTGGLVLMLLNITTFMNAAGACFLSLQLDGVTQMQFTQSHTTLNVNTPTCIGALVAPSAASHTFRATWKVSVAGTVNCQGTERVLTCIEFKR